MRKFKIAFFIVVFTMTGHVFTSHAALLQGFTNCKWGSGDCNPTVADVAHAVETLRTHGDIMGFHITSDVYNFNDKSGVGLGIWPVEHWQGIQRLTFPNQNYLVATRSRHKDNSGAFAVISMGSRDKTGSRLRSNRLMRNFNVSDTWPPINDITVHYEEMDSNFDHAGGFQAVGNWVAIPLESSKDGVNAKVVLYNLSNPAVPKKAPYEVNTSYGNAGTASISKLSDGRFLLIVGGPNATPLYFYLSDGTSLDSDPIFRNKGIWEDSQLDSEIGDFNWCAYQNINIVNQADGEIYLVGLCNDGPLSSPTGEDWIDVHRLEMYFPTKGTINALLSVKVVKVAKRHVYCSWLGIPQQCNLGAAAGTYIDPDNRLIAYSIEHGAEGPLGSVKFEEFRSQENPTSCRTLHDAWIELYEDTDWKSRGLMIDFDDVEYENYSNYEYIESFGDETSSVRWCIPDGYRYALFEHDTFEGQFAHFYGGVGTNHGEVNNLGDWASSGRFECRLNGQWEPIPYNGLILEGEVYDGAGGGGPLNVICAPYLVSGNVIVPAGKTLSISPGLAEGVSLLFRRDSKITVNGTLRVDGTIGPVKFVSYGNSTKGMSINKQLVIRNGGEITIPW